MPQITGRLALWLHRNRRWLRPDATEAGATPADAAPPAGTGPLLLLAVPRDQDDPLALAPVLAALRKSAPDLRILILGGLPAPPAPVAAPAVRRLARLEDPVAIAQLMPEAAALLIIGDDLPPTLIDGAHRAAIPILLVEARLAQAGRGLWLHALTRGLVGLIDHILAPDHPAAKQARALGAGDTAVETIGPVTDTRPPLRGNEAERLAMTELLHGRHVWLAVAPSRPETLAVLAAHHELLHYNHRALLIVAGLSPDWLPDIRARAEQLGMAVILRSDDDDPTDDDQVLIVPEDDELGLWYRLAPVCFMGGTLLAGEAPSARHPFEPAALGSAIIHGPLTDPYAHEWAQLDGGAAAHPISDAEALSRAVTDLTAADQSAILARNAWAVCTGGSAVVRRIVEATLAAMKVKP